MIERLPNHLIRFYRKRRDAREPLALITVLETEGSTYSKAGNQMLVDTKGDFQGMLSGGCLEGDLAERARQVIAAGESEVVTYDLREDDELFGLGVGCDGLMRIVIQPLHAEHGYEPFAALISELESARSAQFDLGEHGVETGVATLYAPLRVLILGAGQDAEPLVVFATELGWQVSVSDHRPASVDRMRRFALEALVCAPVAELESKIDLTKFDAVIVMSHNLAADREYLRVLCDSTVQFVGLLGPPHRKERLLDELGDCADKLSGRLHGPVGKRVGGRGPAAIALEIVSELQAAFAIER